MGVAGEHDVVADLVVVERLERAVLVRHVAVPGVAVVGVLFGAEPGCDVDAGEDNLAAYDAPGGATLAGADELVVEPGWVRADSSSTGALRGTYQFSFWLPIRVLPASFEISVM